MGVKNGSAEIFAFENERARRRAVAEIDPGNFVAIGPYLEAVREGSGLSINDLSARTHIKPAFIAAIEAMRLNDLPARPFAIGFVRVYAEALGADPALAVARFKAEAGFPVDAAEKVAAPAEAAVDTAPAPERRDLSLVAVMAILAFMIWCAFWITRPQQLAPAPVLAPGAEEAGPLDPAPASTLAADVLEQFDPIYPPHCEARAAAVERTEVIFTIAGNGSVLNERIGGSTNACFDRASLNAIRRWRFAPRTGPDGAGQPLQDQTVRFEFRRPS